MPTKKPIWKLELVLSCDGEQVVVGTVARFDRRADLTKDARRRAIEAARLAIQPTTERGK